MVSFGLEAAISARSEPAPLSRLFRTVSVLGSQRSSRAWSVGRKVGRAAGVLLRDAGRKDRPRRLDSQRVNDMVRVSRSRLARATTAMSPIPGRKPDAGT